MSTRTVNQVFFFSCLTWHLSNEAPSEKDRVMNVDTRMIKALAGRQVLVQESGGKRRVEG
jgi:hypothetical protein